jgi:pimeloyl-ACP methyl ester carboxylesterase
MTTRRSFLHLSLGAVAATSTTVTLPHIAQGQGRAFKIKTRDGIRLFEGYRRLRPRRRNDPRLGSTLAMAMQAGVAATAACVDAFATTDFRAELAAVKVPALVLHGTADIPVPFAIGKATATGIAQSKLIEYPDASHGIVLTERDRVTRDLQAFIAS